MVADRRSRSCFQSFGSKINIGCGTSCLCMRRSRRRRARRARPMWQTSASRGGRPARSSAGSSSASRSRTPTTSRGSTKLPGKHPEEIAVDTNLDGDGLATSGETRAEAAHRLRLLLYNGNAPEGPRVRAMASNRGHREARLVRHQSEAVTLIPTRNGVLEVARPLPIRGGREGNPAVSRARESSSSDL